MSRSLIIFICAQSILCSLLMNVSHFDCLYNWFSFIVSLLVKHFVSDENFVKNGICYCCWHGTQKELKSGGKNIPAWSAFFLHSHHFTPHLSLRLPFKHLSSLSDSVSFVGALSRCSNVMSCQACSSFQSYLEREQREQDCRKGAVIPVNSCSEEPAVFHHIYWSTCWNC